MGKNESESEIIVGLSTRTHTADTLHTLFRISDEPNRIYITGLLANF